MNDSLLKFIADRKYKQYFLSAAPYTILNGVEIPVIFYNSKNLLTYNKTRLGKNFITLSSHKYTLPENYSKLIIINKALNNAVFFDCAQTDKLTFDATTRDKIEYIISFSTYSTIVINEVNVKYKVNNALFVFDYLFNTNKPEHLNLFGVDHKSISSKYFRRSLNNISPYYGVEKSQSIIELKVTGKENLIPIDIFYDVNILVKEENIHNVFPLEKKEEENEFYIKTESLHIRHFTINFTGNSSGLVNDNIIECWGTFKKLTKEDLRKLCIDSILKEI